MTYWSLAVEFQYYLFVGLAFSVLAQKGLGWSILIAAFFAIVSLSAGHNVNLLPHYLPLFLLGIVAFRCKCRNASRADLAIGVAVASVLAWYVDGPLEATVAVVTCAAILLVNASSSILDFFGRISYSLYLMHVFVGNVVFGVVTRRPGDLGILKWVLPWLTLGLAILVACIMYRLVEVPSKAWSSRIRYPSRPRAPEALSDRVTGLAAAATGHRA